jgi:hypothetical protein
LCAHAPAATHPTGGQGLAFETCSDTKLGLWPVRANADAKRIAGTLVVGGSAPMIKYTLPSGRAESRYNFYYPTKNKRPCTRAPAHVQPL